MYATPTFINEALHLASIKMSFRKKVANDSNSTSTSLDLATLLGWFGDMLQL